MPVAWAERAAWTAQAVIVTTLLASTATSGAQASPDRLIEVVPYTVVDDTIPLPLAGEHGDPVRGREIVVDRRAGLCLLCHSGPFPDQRFQGNLAPSLAGAGGRWSAGQLRLRIVDPRRLNPSTLMPSYHRVDGLTQVGVGHKDRPVLDARQIEDVIAFLQTLRE